MKLRKATSLTSLFSSIVVLWTSVVLYIVPQGRVAYWADWRLWGLTKEQWGEIHVNVGVVFLVAVGLHLWLNWTPIMSYLKDKARNFTFFTPECTVALAVCAVSVAGTLAMAPPFSWITGFGAQLKDQAAVQYGEPPYGHAELSTLASFAQKTGMDLEAALAALERAGYEIPSPDAVLGEVAKVNGLSPQQLYKAMGGGAPKPAAGGGLPETPPPGVGRMPLAALCESYGLDLEPALAALRAAGVEAVGTKTLKELAETTGRHPQDLYEIVRQAR